MNLSKTKLALAALVVAVVAALPAYVAASKSTTPSAPRFVAAGAMLSCTLPNGAINNVLGSEIRDDGVTIVDLAGRVVSYANMPCQGVELSAAELADAQKPKPALPAPTLPVEEQTKEEAKK